MGTDKKSKNLNECSETKDTQTMVEKLKNQAILMVNKPLPTFDVEKCEHCKNFKCCYQTQDNYIEVKCKKGNKTFLVNGTFSCGQFDYIKRKAK